jgi:hypothetical protein
LCTELVNAKWSANILFTRELGEKEGQAAVGAALAALAAAAQVAATAAVVALVVGREAMGAAEAGLCAAAAHWLNLMDEIKHYGRLLARALKSRKSSA